MAGEDNFLMKQVGWSAVPGLAAGIKKPARRLVFLNKLVGTRGFEPPTPDTP